MHNDVIKVQCMCSDVTEVQYVCRYRHKDLINAQLCYNNEVMKS